MYDAGYVPIDPHGHPRWDCARRSVENAWCALADKCYTSEACLKKEGWVVVKVLPPPLPVEQEQPRSELEAGKSFTFTVYEQEGGWDCYRKVLKDEYFISDERHGAISRALVDDPTFSPRVVVKRTCIHVPIREMKRLFDIAKESYDD